jgi:hypothetical protein
VPLLRRKSVIGTSVVAVALIVFLLLPIVPYTVSFTNPNLSNGQGQLTPISINGYATPSYYLLGVGSGPYPSTMISSQGGFTYLLHFQGSHISYVEPIVGLPSNATLDPQGMVKVDNVSISQWAFGFLNFSARVTNIGSRTLWNVGLAFNYPSFGGNGTVGMYRSYSAPTTACATVLAPGASCSGSTFLNETTVLLTDQFYPMSLEVSCAKTTPGPSTPFLFVDTLALRYPGVGLNTHWVASFIQEVNAQRNGTALTENRTLDEFAAFRFDSIRAQYQISDYNFTYDYYRFFGQKGPVMEEEILYPAGKDPNTYPAYLKQNAPGHYAGLVDPAYSHFGYFFGTGPSVDIGPGCSATEIPGPNINITQFVISHGCDYVIADEIWFILILAA